MLPRAILQTAKAPEESKVQGRCIRDPESWHLPFRFSSTWHRNDLSSTLFTSQYHSHWSIVIIKADLSVYCFLFLFIYQSLLIRSKCSLPKPPLKTAVTLIFSTASLSGYEIVSLCNRNVFQAIFLSYMTNCSVSYSSLHLFPPDSLRLHSHPLYQAIRPV